MARRRTRNRSDDLRWGIRWGLVMAGLYSALVIVFALVQGSLRFDRYGANLFQILLGYLAAGLLGGAIVGWLRPFNDSAWGRAFIGLLASVPVFSAFMVVLSGLPSQWTRNDWLALVTTIVIVGPLAGAYESSRRRS